MRSTLIFSLIIFFIANTVLGQQSRKYSSNYSHFYRAEELYSKSQFSAARKEFRSFINSNQNDEDPFLLKAYYFEGLCALELQNTDAIELLEAFNKKYPENIFLYETRFTIAKHFYKYRQFKDAQTWFLKVPAKELKKEDREEYFFKLGYSALEKKNYNLAYTSFRDAKDGDGPYALPSLYFFSHLSYEKGANQLAIEGFLKLQKDSTYCGIVPYYLAQIYQRLGQYDEVIKLAPSVIKCSFLNNEADINHIIGNAYYKLKKYDKAIPYLEYFSSKGKPNRDDSYELGYSYYKNQQYEKAIKQFSKATGKTDSMKQISLYQIGECYLKIKNPLPARSAFERASQMNFISEIQEDALYNFAVISFNIDINPYNESVRAFETYLNKYPTSPKRKDVYEYLVKVYTNSTNFSDALESIKRLPDLDIRMKKVFQTVAFNYGVDLFEKKQLTLAAKAFQEVNTFPVDPEKVALAKYWIADIQLRTGKMENAINTYKDFINSPASNSLPEKADAYYNIGYAYLKINNLTAAIESFRNYLQFNPSDANKILDAHFRIADCFYVREDDGDNLLAIDYYSKTAALNSNQTDKALYYLSKSYGYNGDIQLRIATLKRIINEFPTSQYMMKTKYDLGWANMSIKNYEEALDIFKKYLSSYPTSQNKIEVRLAIADVYFKMNDFERSEEEFKKILSEYSSIREVCATAVNGLIEVYKGLNRLNDAAQIADQYGCAEISMDEKENIFYIPALEAYNKDLWLEAKPKFEAYLSKFPDGKYVVESYFFLGNCQYRLGDTTEAVLNFEKFLEFPTSEHTDIAALRSANYYYKNLDYVKALLYYEKLDLIAVQPSDILAAKIGISRCGFFTENFEKCAKAAKEILKTNGISNIQKKDAHYAYGISKFKLGEYTEAQPSLEWLVKNTTTVMGAEAKYLIAELYFFRQEYNDAITEIKALLRMKPSYDYWVAKGLLLQARSEMVLEKYFEAENNVKSVLDHYPIEDDGILAEASEIWDELMQIKNAENKVEDEPEKRIQIND